MLHNQIYEVDNCWDKSGQVENTFLCVYNGQDLSHHVKKILLPPLFSESNDDAVDEGGMATCRWSNSLYVWQSGPSTWPHGSDIWRLVPNADGGFRVMEWPTFAPSDESLDFSSVSRIVINDVSVLDDGNLLVLREVFCSCDEEEVNHILSIHRPDGSVIRDIILSYNAVISNVAMKSNGNFVYAQVTRDLPDDCVIQEVDKDGKAVRHFHCSHFVSGFHSGCKQLFLDACDRVIFLDGYDKCIFLDCELNFLGEVEILEVEPVNAFNESSMSI